MRKGILTDELTSELLIKPIRESGLIISGFVIGNSDQQHVNDIVTMAKGELKEFPVMGVGIINFLKSTGKEREMVREIKVQLSLDGYDEANINIQNGQFKIQI